MARLKYEDVKKEIVDYGWGLVTTDYKNLDTEMEFICQEGHKVFTTLKKFRKNPYCPTCAEKALLVDVDNPVAKEKDVVRVLAIDDATSLSGWSVFDGKELVGYGVFRVEKEDPIERISIVKQWMLNMLIKWNPDKVGIEDIQLQHFRGANGVENYAVTTYKVLAQLQGVLLEALHLQGKESIIVHSQTWKSFCGISAKSRTDQKRSAQLKVKEWYGVNVGQDEADAICMGKYLSEKYIRNSQMVSWE